MQGVDHNALLDSFLASGFQATNFGLAVQEINKMRAWRLRSPRYSVLDGNYDLTFFLRPHLFPSVMKKFVKMKMRSFVILKFVKTSKEPFFWDIPRIWHHAACAKRFAILQNTKWWTALFRLLVG